MAAEPTQSRRSMRWIGVATALMCALAGGAVWCVLQIYLRFDLIGLAILIGIVIAKVLRAHGFARSIAGALTAAIATALAVAYAGYLLAAVQVASFLGIPLGSTLTKIGAEMAFAVTKADASAFHIGTVVLAIALSAWMVWRKP
jgi:hypothetical protein